MVKFSKNSASAAEKESIRTEMLAKLRSQDLGERNIKSHEIKRRLFTDRYFQAAKSVMFYISLDYEVNTRDMIEEALKSGKRVIVPVTKTSEKRLILSEITDPGNQLHKGAFGIDEPKREYIKAVPAETIDVVIVPGVAFDREGNRIGHGKGYFDRFLKDLPKKIPTIGLAFSFQLIDRIKALPWDVPVTKVITA
jgi:5-formyltetrahydrofolate cyclo-ligase